MYRQSEKKFLNCSIFSTCRHNTANFGPLAAEIGSGFWGTPAHFNGFRVLPSSLQRRRSPEANQTLHDVWPSPRTGYSALRCVALRRRAACCVVSATTWPNISHY